jgi:O-antigen ligase
MLVLTKRSPRATVAERAVFAGFLLTLALVPLPFGADRPWAWSLFAVAIGGLLLAWGALAAHSRSYQAASIRPLLPAVGLFVLVVLWAAVQASGLVPPEWRHPLWRAAEAALGRPLAGGVSLDDHGTWTATMRLMCYGGVFLLSFQLCISSDRSERLIRLLIGMAMIYACYGLFVQSAGIDRVLWYARGDAVGLSSTFLDPDGFAAYAGLGLLSAIALLSRPAMRKGDLSSSWKFATRALADFFFARAWTMLLGVAALFGALMMTQSRAGLAAVLLGAGAYLAVMAWVRGGRTAALVGVAVMAVAVSSLLALAGGPGAAPGIAAERGGAYALTVKAISAEPLLGAGYGTHRRIFGMLPGDGGGNAARPVENAFLEYALEIGVPATVALMLAVGWIVLLCFSSVRRHRRAAYLPCLGVAATVLACAHGAVDHGVQIPAVAATYAAILGAACAQAFRLEIPERRAGERRAA